MQFEGLYAYLLQMYYNRTTSGFNGGKHQTFTVYYKRNDNDGNSEWTAFERTYSDHGQNMYTSAEIQPVTSK
jgi:hypothetical protein